MSCPTLIISSHLEIKTNEDFYDSELFWQGGYMQLLAQFFLLSIEKGGNPGTHIESKK